jgi:hypothetical protein
MDLEKRVIQSNQDVHVCGIYVEWMYVVEVAMCGVYGDEGESLILLCSLKYIYLFLELGDI